MRGLACSSGCSGALVWEFPASECPGRYTHRMSDRCYFKITNFGKPLTLLPRDPVLEREFQLLQRKGIWAGLNRSFPQRFILAGEPGPLLPFLNFVKYLHYAYIFICRVRAPAWWAFIWEKWSQTGAEPLDFVRFFLGPHRAMLRTDSWQAGGTLG